MSTDLEREMKEIQLEEVNQEKKEENLNLSKIAKGKKFLNCSEKESIRENNRRFNHNL